MNKRFSVKLAATFAAASLALTACGGNSGDQGNGAGGDDDKTYEIGISQFVSHASLDAAAKGFKDGLEEAGLNVNIDEQNAQADQGTVATISRGFQDKDLVLAIATPSALGAAKAITDKPVLFTAVTDPEGANLVDSNDAPGKNVTGTSDMNPVADQIKLITEIKPDAKKIGIVYSSGESNSEIQVKMAKEAAEELGVEIQERAVSQASEVQQAAQALDVDAIYVPTDNVVVSTLGSVIRVAEQKKIPVIAAEGDSVKNGALATIGLDYEDLGKQTADMAVKILKDGADPAEMAVETPKDLKLYVNEGAAEKFGVEIPSSVLDRADEKF
ncbi:ABC transporter substrate-binding protein [Micrococcoides hystricis]|uniref:ABC transporter substrate-binding protein n=1 Tax=Micrococcoides hystricis TaxID=1572761 RepID=A0ABV6PBR1_9MICC